MASQNIPDLHSGAQDSSPEQHVDAAPQGSDLQETPVQQPDTRLEDSRQLGSQSGDGTPEQQPAAGRQHPDDETER